MGLLTGKVALVTGASQGIGRVIAEGLAREDATLTILARNVERTERARDEIIATTGNPKVNALCADLSVMENVRRAAAAFRGANERLDVLVNNAGAWNETREVTPDGCELTFAVNHLAYFLLTHELLPLLKASAPSRIVNLASAAHRSGTVDLADLQSERGYFGFRVYSNTKLMNILYTRELARRLEGTGVTANAVHPGTVASGFGANNQNMLGFGWKLLKPFMRTTVRGAEGSIFLATAPEVEGVTGKYWKDRHEERSSDASKDMAMAGRLWAESERLCGINRA